MKNLLQRLIGRGKSRGKTRLSSFAIEPFFQMLAVDINTIGFPSIKDRNRTATMCYNCTFDNVRAAPVGIKNGLSIIITGDYETQAQASYEDSDGNWRPGIPSRYKFRIENGKLEIKRRF